MFRMALKGDWKYPVQHGEPIIIVTALSDNDSRIVAFGAGANDYLTKPYHPRELALKIKDLIDITE